MENDETLDKSNKPFLTNLHDSPESVRVDSRNPRQKAGRNQYDPDESSRFVRQNENSKKQFTVLILVEDLKVKQRAQLIRPHVREITLIRWVAWIRFTFLRRAFCQYEPRV